MFSFQVVLNWVNKLCFVYLLQAGELNFFTSFSHNLGHTFQSIPVEGGQGRPGNERVTRIGSIPKFLPFLPFAFYRRCEGEKAESCRTWARLGQAILSRFMHRVAWISPLVLLCGFSQRGNHFSALSFAHLFKLHMRA